MYLLSFLDSEHHKTLTASTRTTIDRNGMCNMVPLHRLKSVHGPQNLVSDPLYLG